MRRSAPAAAAPTVDRVDQAAGPPGREPRDACSASIEPSNGTASRPSTRSSRTCSTAAANASSSAIQASLRQAGGAAARSTARAGERAQRRVGDVRTRTRSRCQAISSRDRALLQHPDPVEVLEVVDGVGDVVGGVHHRRLRRSAASRRSAGERRPGPGAGRPARCGKRRTSPTRVGVVRAAGRRPRGGGNSRVGCGSGWSQPGPRVLEHGRAHRGGEVEPGAARPVHSVLVTMR